eukprot:TRINITY_DN2070_c0_g1_i1.p2 TRINITY_DN2070_c0_g1~~TRINITY_DN2070_c0_g1_i1.p2  ORF type:complete len:354 (+),score=107.34 TRINITY_DN2070_c0_g1_i1:270-1331(+)
MVSAEQEGNFVDKKVTGTSSYNHLKKLDAKQSDKKVNEYLETFDSAPKEDLYGKRKEGYMDMVNHFYDLVTDLYEYGWGQSFHFAPRHKNETFEASISRHEHYLAAKMGLKKGDKVLDVGCGVGGPLREIARFSGAHITGINNNGYQISRGQAYNEKCGLDKTCGFLQTDFMNIDVPDQSQDAVYQIEATAHAPDKVACFKEIFRTLKPGGVFAGYEWCMTDKYVPGNEEHEHIRHEICRGNGLPDIATTTEVVEALKAAGFEVEEYEDHALRDDIPWYWPLCGTWGAWFRRTRVGNKMTSLSLRVMETLRIAPRGSHDVTMILEGAATSLIQGGETGTFTPMFFYVARKPSA